jgi:hypothetical protein
MSSAYDDFTFVTIFVTLSYNKAIFTVDEFVKSPFVNDFELFGKKSTYDVQRQNCPATAGFDPAERESFSPAEGGLNVLSAPKMLMK